MQLNVAESNMNNTMADNTFDSLLLLGAKYANFFIFLFT